MTSNQLEFINRLIRRLENGEGVTKKDLANALSPDKFDYLYSIDPRLPDTIEANSRKKLRPYEEKLKEASYKYAAEQRSASNMKKLFNESDTLYESALEALDLVLKEFPRLVHSLDRPVVMRSNGEIDYSRSDISARIEGVPRHVDSKSAYTRKPEGIRSFRMKSALVLLKDQRDELLMPSPTEAPEQTVNFKSNEKKSRRNVQINIDEWKF